MSHQQDCQEGPARRGAALHSTWTLLKLPRQREQREASQVETHGRNPLQVPWTTAANKKPEERERNWSPWSTDDSQQLEKACRRE